jgi:hypothetical protein
MTEYEILMAVLTAIGVIAGVGSLIVALLNFLDKRNNKHK